MRNRIVEVASREIALSVSNSLLSIAEKEKVTTIPLEEIATLLITERAVSLTGAVISELGEHGAIIVHCDKHYLPSAMTLPLASTYLREIIETQVALSQVLSKQLWRAVIKKKNYQSRTCSQRGDRS